MQQLGMTAGSSARATPWSFVTASTAHTSCQLEGPTPPRPWRKKWTTAPAMGVPSGDVTVAVAGKRGIEGSSPSEYSAACGSSLLDCQSCCTSHEVPATDAG